MKYLAHISEDRKREESVLEHAQKVAEKAKSFAKIFDAASWGYCCGMMHDIGKYSKEFNERLHGGAPVDHATAGAQELNKKKGLYLLAAYCVAGHHAGLPDTGTPADPAGSATMQGRLKKKLADYMDYKKEISIPELTMPTIQVIDGFSVPFFIRMIYSCLVDADFLETENFMKENETIRDSGIISKELLDRLMNYIALWLSLIHI
jgi:CRISPR-associated endonuclease/helicase Cas3